MLHRRPGRVPSGEPPGSLSGVLGSVVSVLVLPNLHQTSMLDFVMRTVLDLIVTAAVWEVVHTGRCAAGPSDVADACRASQAHPTADPKCIG